MRFCVLRSGQIGRIVRRRACSLDFLSSSCAPVRPGHTSAPRSTPLSSQPGCCRAALLFLRCKPLDSRLSAWMVIWVISVSSCERACVLIHGRPCWHQLLPRWDLNLRSTVRCELKCTLSAVPRYYQRRMLPYGLVTGERGTSCATMPRNAWTVGMKAYPGVYQLTHACT